MNALAVVRSASSPEPGWDAPLSERHSSRCCPAITSVTRSVLIPRPAGAARLCFSGSFHNKSPARMARGFVRDGRDFLRLLPPKRPLPLGAGHTR